MPDMEFIAIGKNAKDITGQRFGRLVTLGPVRRTKNSQILWLCQCDCGSGPIVVSANLLSGNSTSCGCLRRGQIPIPLPTYKLTQHPLYKTWVRMVNRCNNQNEKGYRNYGGRGITVCDDWRHDFDAFKNHVTSLSHCGEEGYSIDRIDNALGYFPGNVKWSTRTEQNRNKRDNHLLTHNDKTQSIGAWAKESNIPYGILWGRLHRGWPIEKAISTSAENTQKGRNHE